MNGFSACAPILLSTNSRYTKVTSTHAALMAAQPTRVRIYGDFYMAMKTQHSCCSALHTKVFVPSGFQFSFPVRTDK